MPERTESVNTEEIEKELVSIITPEGEEIEAEVLIFFELQETGKKYLVYTHNEKDKNDMVTVYASAFVEKDEQIYLEAIESEEEWDKVKDVMRQTIKYGGDE